jgi:hypothetical protein
MDPASSRCHFSNFLAGHFHSFVATDVMLPLLAEAPCWLSSPAARILQGFGWPDLEGALAKKKLCGNEDI